MHWLNSTLKYSLAIEVALNEKFGSNLSFDWFVVDTELLGFQLPDNNSYGLAPFHSKTYSQNEESLVSVNADRHLWDIWNYMSQNEYPRSCLTLKCTQLKKQSVLLIEVCIHHCAQLLTGTAVVSCTYKLNEKGTREGGREWPFCKVVGSDIKTNAA